MRSRLTISALCLATFLTLNIIVALINIFLGHFTPGQLSDLIGSVFTCFITSALLFISFLLPGRFAYSWRFPVIRIVFWTIVCLFDYGNKSLYLVSELLATINGYLCFFYNSVSFGIFHGQIPDINSAPAQLFFIDIIGVALYEVVVIKVAIYIFQFLQIKRVKPI
jgi:hypothetical protein